MILKCHLRIYTLPVTTRNKMVLLKKYCKSNENEWALRFGEENPDFGLFFYIREKAKQ